MNLGFFRFESALRAYRVMAFVTGIVLTLGTLGLIAEATGVHVSDSAMSVLWIAHGYLFMAYVLVTINLGLHRKWGLVRIALTALAGTVPTMSFVAERVVVKDVRH